MDIFDEYKIKRWHIFGALFTSVVGTLLHFVYEWTGGNVIAGIFGAVDESTFEHLKLFFWPFIFFSIIEYAVYGKNNGYFLPARAVTVFLGIFLITDIFYTYSGILGFSVTFIDIAIFYISVISAYVVSYKRIINKKKLFGTDSRFLAPAILLLMCILFVAFSFYKPDLGLFKPPV